ncbi:MAG: HEAT repeat domain-containing protein [Ilumatobacter sp.]|uniref:HEAT repeat domain-containing protein n=1 Tax=Ilumatobacter sp. TaxID=1967498 RepID=UPI0026315943|nr:HEAT repeat domain-containing protein [Ilumatobacter sp.]MDJ0768676.1 HEAT repeat domain-containing protein [Ilumatobacter sp.]
MSARDLQRRIVVAGHEGDSAIARDHLAHADPGVRAAALGALERVGDLTDDELAAAFDDADRVVRHRAAELAARHPAISLLQPLHDRDAGVVEVAAWACGEHEAVGDDVLDRLIELATAADDPLVREAGVAALGAIGDGRALPAVLAACTDKPQIRRRAVLALAPFSGAEVEAAIDRALEDRDWQVRQGAEDLRRVDPTDPTDPTES